MKKYFNVQTSKQNNHSKKMIYNKPRYVNTDVEGEFSAWNRLITAKDSQTLNFNKQCISEVETYKDVYSDYTYGFNSGYAQPLLETLYYNYPDSFIALVQKVSDCQNEEIKKLLISAITKTDLHQKGLYTWNNAIKQNVLASITELKGYAEKLQGTVKASHANDLADELTEKVNEGPKLIAGEQTLNSFGPEDTLTQKLNILIFKTNLLVMAHKKDHIFKECRGWKRFTLHLIAGLCCPPLGLIFIAYAAATNKFPFFSKTTTERHVGRILKAADIDASLKPPASLALLR